MSGILGAHTRSTQGTCHAGEGHPTRASDPGPPGSPADEWAGPCPGLHPLSCWAWVPPLGTMRVGDLEELSGLPCAASMGIYCPLCPALHAPGRSAGPGGAPTASRGQEPSGTCLRQSSPGPRSCPPRPRYAQTIPGPSVYLLPASQPLLWVGPAPAIKPSPPTLAWPHQSDFLLPVGPRGCSPLGSGPYEDWFLNTLILGPQLPAHTGDTPRSQITFSKTV